MTIARKKARKSISGSLEGKNPQPCVVSEGAIRDPRVQIVIDFMNANLHRRTSLTDLAEVAALSTSHLSRLFKAQTGLPPGDYLGKLRMEKARNLLGNRLLRIKEIMAQTGYNNKSHFVRHFRRSFGLSPSEYRKSVSAS